MNLIGDIHGEWQLYFNMLKRRVHGPSIQLGDHGFGFKNDATYCDKKLRRLGHWFFRGNHDSPEECRQQANYLGDAGFRSPAFFVSGGFSIDKATRKPGISWWEEEELTEVQRRAVVELYREVKPEIVLSHDAPTTAAQAVLRPFLVPRSDQYGSWQDRGYYEDKMKGVGTGVISKMLQEMLEIHAPRLWYFAHFHTTRVFTLEASYQTRFTVLGINDVIQVPFEFESEDSITVDSKGILHGPTLADYRHALESQRDDNEGIPPGGSPAEINPPLADPGQA